MDLIKIVEESFTGEKKEHLNLRVEILLRWPIVS